MLDLGIARVLRVKIKTCIKRRKKKVQIVWFGGEGAVQESEREVSEYVPSWKAKERKSAHKSRESHSTYSTRLYVQRSHSPVHLHQSTVTAYHIRTLYKGCLWTTYTL